MFNVSKARILIADDTHYFYDILYEILMIQGYEIYHAKSGFQALEISKSLLPDLILLDIQKSEIDSYEVCIQLKECESTADIPIIFISTLENFEDKIQAFSVGGVDYINKPFQVIEVLARIQCHLRIRFLQLQLQEQADLLKDQNISLKQEIAILSGTNFLPYKDLSVAIKENQLQLYYQPIIDLKSEEIVGFEALLRWKYPTLGNISPSDFVPVAELTGDILEIGRWTIATACKQLKEWQQISSRYANLSMNVNVSTKQLTEINLVCFVKEVLAVNQIPAAFLKLEITENLVIDNHKISIKVLRKLKDLGIQLCIDDFGIGYSSLRRLNDFPFDTIKIDRSFIQREEWVMVKAIAMMALALGKNVVAEGIETHKQLKALNLMDCRQGQGYLFAKPASADVVTASLTNSIYSTDFRLCDRVPR